MYSIKQLLLTALVISDLNSENVYPSIHPCIHFTGSVKHGAYPRSLRPQGSVHHGQGANLLQGSNTQHSHTMVNLKMLINT